MVFVAISCEVFEIHANILFLAKSHETTPLIRPTEACASQTPPSILHASARLHAAAGLQPRETIRWDTVRYVTIEKFVTVGIFPR